VDAAQEGYADHGQVSLMAARGCADLVIIPDRREGREAPLELLVGFNEYRYRCQALGHRYVWHRYVTNQQM
jgi:hypothetical protein